MTYKTLLIAAASGLAVLCPMATPAAAQSAAKVEAELPSGADIDVLTAQVLLDRTRFSPGVIDGRMGGNTARAIRAFQRARELEVVGNVSSALLDRLRSENENGEPVLRRHKLTQEDVSGPFVDLPGGFEEQARLDRLGYSSAIEKLAETFHMAESFLKALNPGASFAAGEEIWIAAPGESGLGAKVARIEIDKGTSGLRALDADGKVLAVYPATIGSGEFPSPSGSMEVRAVAPEAIYYFDPEGRDWGPDKRLEIAAGPNNPVGGIWIDLTKDGYGIHGSPDPKLIGKTSSHGCVRLTNWDARELAEAVEQGTDVVFVG